MTSAQTFLMLASWVLLVPPAAAQVARDISEEKIMERPTAFIQARWPGSLLAYLVRCPTCLTHWFCFLAAIAWIPLWCSFPVPAPAQLIIAIIGSFAAARISISKWL